MASTLQWVCLIEPIRQFHFVDSTFSCPGYGYTLSIALNFGWDLYHWQETESASASVKLYIKRRRDHRSPGPDSEWLKPCNRPRSIDLRLRRSLQLCSPCPSAAPLFVRSSDSAKDTRRGFSERARSRSDSGASSRSSSVRREKKSPKEMAVSVALDQNCQGRAGKLSFQHLPTAISHGKQGYTLNTRCFQPEFSHGTPSKPHQRTNRC